MSEKPMVAIITARGGSKRIPRKNVKNFLGKPIIAYSIEAAIESGLFDEVMVSTDDKEIADIARSCGAEVPFLRSAETSDDFATTVDVLLEVLQTYEAIDRHFNLFCCIYPTAPFVTPKKLHAAFELLVEGVNCVFTATEFSYPPQRGLMEKDGLVGFWMPRYAKTRSQDLPRIYHDAGQFYFGRTQALVEDGKLIGGKSRMLFVPDTEVQDIDNESDWKIAELKYLAMGGSLQGQS